VSRSVFNPPAPLWGEGVLDNFKTLVLWTTNKVVRRSRQCRFVQFLGPSFGAKRQDRKKYFHPKKVSNMVNIFIIFYILIH
jgi:hypothetical protein